MSAETLRKAAALMRERAEAATPGPWDSTEDAQVVAGYGSPFDGEQLADCFQVDPASGPNAVHMASWHPAVARAVADLLIEAAEVLSAGYTDGFDNDDLFDKELAVARAYLGELA